MSKKKKHGGKKLTAKELQIEILKFLLVHSRKKFAPPQITDQLHIENNRDSVEYALNQLVHAGSAEVLDGKYGAALHRLVITDEPVAPIPDKKDKQKKETPPQFERFVKDKKDKTREPRHKPVSARQKLVEGRVDMTRTGAAYIINEMLDTDIYIPQRYVNGAMHGDRVSVSLFPEPPRRKGAPIRKPEGQIIQVLKRSNDSFLGTLRLSRKYAMFIPDNPNVPTDFFVPLDAIGAAKDGDTVVVRVTDWHEGQSRVPTAKVTEILGNSDGHDFEMKKILINAGFELSHSPEAMAEAAAIPLTISPSEIERRRDFRGILTFTIDPEDAKDFDDALSIRQLENGEHEIGVHIADVTHYLKPDSPLDQEAYKRSTSVYLVDRCLPMLPEKLSNNLCSLVPEQDRLTFSAVFNFNTEGKITKRWFGKTVIYSDKRFSYEAAQEILEAPAPKKGKKKNNPEEQFYWALHTLDKIAKQMRKEREKNGAIGFETDEIRFLLEEDGTPIEAYVKERRDAHLLIEDFMLLANKEVAFYIDQKAQNAQEVPFVYRIHDLPDMEKVAEFARFAAEMGHPMKVDTPRQIAKSFNLLMQKARTDDRLKILEPLAIRTMAKAVYSTENIGHYGLGFQYYAHFTSPIRRYSDVLAHRILERNLEGRTYRLDKTALEEKCKHVSAQERKAAEAERESVKLKQAELTSQHIGETFEGTITGMIERGFFVALPGSHAEGFVEFRYTDDTYDLEEGRLRARGKRYKRVLKMGDKIKVTVQSVDLAKRQIELVMSAE